MRLGELLIAHQQISEGQLLRALEYQVIHHEKLGEALIRIGCLSEDMLLRFLSMQLNLPYIESLSDQKTVIIQQVLSESDAKKNCCILVQHQDKLVLVMRDPTEHATTKQLQERIGAMVEFAFAKESTIRFGIDKYYKLAVVS